MAGLLALFMAQASASATPGVMDVPSAAAKVNLGLDSRTAGRLLADAKEGGASTADDESPKAMDTKPDEMKLTVTKGEQAKKPAPAASSGDSLAFLKDWPFWVIVGGVVVASAATYMIVRNSNQGHSCLGDTFPGGCHGAN